MKPTCKDESMINLDSIKIQSSGYENEVGHLIGGITIGQSLKIKVKLK